MELEKAETIRMVAVLELAEEKLVELVMRANALQEQVEDLGFFITDRQDPPTQEEIHLAKIAISTRRQNEPYF